ncbi:hypothetical protein [Phormidesmis sp. 146-35]
MPDLRSGATYTLGFDDWNGDPIDATANGNGVAQFENVDFPEPFTSDEIGRRAVIILTDPVRPWIETVVQAPYLAEIPGC